MKKNLASNLFLFSGILTIVSYIINEDNSLGIPLGCAFITLGIVTRKKAVSEKNIEEGELLVDGEEKQVDGELQKK